MTVGSESFRNPVQKTARKRRQVEMEKAALKVAGKSVDELPDFESLLKSGDFQTRLERARALREANLHGQAAQAEAELSSLKKPWEIQARKLARADPRRKPLVLERTAPAAPPDFAHLRDVERPSPRVAPLPVALPDPAAGAVLPAPVVRRPVSRALRPVAGFMLGAALGIAATWLYRGEIAGTAAPVFVVPADAVGGPAAPVLDAAAPVPVLTPLADAVQRITPAALPPVATASGDVPAVALAGLPARPALRFVAAGPALPQPEARPAFAAPSADTVPGNEPFTLGGGDALPDAVAVLAGLALPRPDVAAEAPAEPVAPATARNEVAAVADALLVTTGTSLGAAVTPDGRPAIPAAAAAAPGLSILVFAPAGTEFGAADARIRAAGFALSSQDHVDFDVRRNDVRFYHETDRAAAETLAGVLEAEPRDFTDFSPAPPQGHIEVWLAGTPETAAARTAPPATVKALAKTTKTTKASAKAARAKAAKPAAPGLTDAQEMQRLRDSILWQLQNPGP